MSEPVSRSAEYVMGKTKFKRSWLETRTWLSAINNDSSKAYCKACYSYFSIVCVVGQVDKHDQTDKHKNAVEELEKQSRFQFSVDNLYVKSPKG